MKRTLILATSLFFGTSTYASAKTFTHAPMLPDEGVDTLNRSVTQAAVDRDLFGEPYATVVVGHVDVYDRFPYLESRYFQIVSDPQWNRLLFGEVGQGLAAHTGAGDAFGELRGPRGLSSDESGKLYVADTDNHRVLVYQTWNEYDRMELTPLYAIEGLARPHDVAFSDAGTPFDASDDRLYVADTGRNRIVSYRLSASGATPAAEIGDLGSGVGRFAGPFAITVGRTDGRNNTDVYVSDSHNGRIVRLIDRESRFDWASEVASPGHVSSLDTDHYGSVYAASPSAGLVAKYSAELRPVAELSSGVERPRAFHVPFVTRRDHRDGTVKRVGEGSGLIVEEWTDHSGIRMVKMGVEVRDLRVSADHDVTADFTVTDRASVRGELVEVSTGRVVHSADFGEMGSGARTVSVPAADLDDVLYDGEYVLRLQAESPYGAETETAETSFTWNGGNVRTLPSVATLMGNDPNPFQRSTSITFAIPEGRSASYTLSVYDVTGRLVRTVASGQVEPGLHTIAWDGRDSGNREVASGVYLYRLSVGDEISTRKMVLVRR